MRKEKVLHLLDELIESGDQLITNMKSNPYDLDNSLNIKAYGFNTECLNLIKNIAGENSDFYINFNKIASQRPNSISISRSVEVLKGLRRAVDNGLIEDIQSILSKEFFNAVADAAEEWLEKGYKSNAAMEIGIALEQRIHSLCIKHGVDIERISNGKSKRIATDTLNAELVKSGVYNTTTQKHVTAWLGIRNSAAHGRDDEYDDNQVAGMIDGVRDFLDNHTV